MSDIRNLEPGDLWNYFYEICQLPHPSRKEAKIIEYVRNFGERNGLETIVDSVGNVIIKKAATPGFEARKGVVLQTHLDMVPQKNSDKKHDFAKDPIEVMIDGEWVTANGTTLGSDNGIGVSAAMAVLASKDIEHGPLEALFTIDEETGMTGAFGLKPGLIDADILINMDSEDEGELYVGCAGGIDVTATKSYSPEDVPAGMKSYRLDAKGLKGGHSGIDIPLGRANANMIIFRFLLEAETRLGVRLAESAGGDLRNAIPREANAVVAVAANRAEEFEMLVEEYEGIYKNEFDVTEPGLIFGCEPCDTPGSLVPEKEQYGFTRSVFACPNGAKDE